MSKLTNDDNSVFSNKNFDTLFNLLKEENDLSKYPTYDLYELTNSNGLKAVLNPKDALMLALHQIL